MSLIVCKMPRAGLGNQLFPLMKAVVLQKLTGLPLIITHYHQLKLGPYLRGEKSKRSYKGYFRFQKNLVAAWMDTVKLKLHRGYTIVQDPLIEEAAVPSNHQCIYVYTTLPHWEDHFAELKDHRDMVVNAFYEMLSPRILKQLQHKAAPCIGVHIRMGDFRKPGPGLDFSTMGTIRTPESYFIDIIQKTRQIAGKILPVTVFTDGYRSDFAELFNLPAVSMAENNSDIVDMILMSKSRIIVTSATSTYSYWAGFLSEAALIMHPSHIHASIRPASMMNTCYEGPFDPANALLIKNITSINE